MENTHIYIERETDRHRDRISQSHITLPYLPLPTSDSFIYILLYL